MKPDAVGDSSGGRSQDAAATESGEGGEAMSRHPNPDREYIESLKSQLLSARLERDEALAAIEAEGMERAAVEAERDRYRKTVSDFRQCKSDERRIWKCLRPWCWWWNPWSSATCHQCGAARKVDAGSVVPPRQTIRGMCSDDAPEEAS